MNRLILPRRQLLTQRFGVSVSKDSVVHVIGDDISPIWSLPLIAD
jgi:hypothetical protein